MEENSHSFLVKIYLRYKWILSAIWETSLNLFVSAAPMLAGVVVLTAGEKHGGDFAIAFQKITNNGELVIYAATLMAPILYAIQKDPPPKFKELLLIVGLMTWFMGVVIYVAGIYDSFNESIVLLSAACLGAAVFIYFLLNCLNHQSLYRESAPQIFEAKKKDNLSDYKAHRRG